MNKYDFRVRIGSLESVTPVETRALLRLLAPPGETVSRAHRRAASCFCVAMELVAGPRYGVTEAGAAATAREASRRNARRFFESHSRSSSAHSRVRASTAIRPGRVARPLLARSPQPRWVTQKSLGLASIRAAPCARGLAKYLAQLPFER